MQAIAETLFDIGDSFHLVPRIYALCTTGLENYTALLGAGKFVTSVCGLLFFLASAFIFLLYSGPILFPWLEC